MTPASPIRRRKPWGGALLSLVTPGLGHLYAGAPRAAVVVFVLCAAALAASIAAGLLVPWPPFNTLIMAAGCVAVPVAAAVSAYRLARRSPEDYRLRRYNRWYVYVAVALVAAYGLAPLLTALQRRYVAQAFRMPSVSMQPTILAGDFVFVRRFAGVPEHLGRRDIVVYESLTDPGVSIVKRIVGLPGDTLQMARRTLVVNGRPQLEPYTQHVDSLADPSDTTMLWQRGFVAGLSDATAYHPSRDTWGPIVVPPDGFFVLGDNRDNSYDSRYWGFVPRQRIRGRLARIYFSYDPASRRALPFLTAIRWGRIGQPVP